MSAQLVPWDLEGVRMTDKNLARVLRAAIATGSRLTDYYISEGYYKNPNRNEVHMRVLIPEGRNIEFAGRCPGELVPAPRVSGAS